MARSSLWRRVSSTFLVASLGLGAYAEGALAQASKNANKRKKKAPPAEETEQGEDGEAPKDEVVGETDDGRKIVKKSDSIEHDSSEAMRQGKVGSVVAEVGFGIGGIPTSGIAGGYYLRSHSIVELSHISGEYDLFFVKVEGTLTELRLKRFWGNSFYTNLGLGYRTIKLSATLEPLTGTDEISSSLSVSSIGGSIGIGNRWQWETFTMGCDWIGTFVPASNTGETKVKDTTATEEDKERLEREANDLGKTGSAQLLRFYLGVSF